MKAQSVSINALAELSVQGQRAEMKVKGRRKKTPQISFNMNITDSFISLFLFSC